MNDILKTINTRTTPQRERARADQVENSAGGFVFAVDDWTRLRRFLTLGVEGGTFYVSPKNLARDNALVIFRCIGLDPIRTVNEIVEISESGRAPKQNPAIFALAAATSMGDDKGRTAALNALGRVVRTGTHLFLFLGYVEQFRGWGRGLRRAVGGWYTDPAADAVAYQAIKYRQREGWTHRDALRLASPVTAEPSRRALFDWITHGNVTEGLPAIVGAYLAAQSATSTAQWVSILREHPSLPWEALPDQAITKPEVWATLIENGLPQTALLRQLPRLTRLGVLEGSLRSTVVTQLTDFNRLRKARVHPISVLLALRTYTQGHSERGSSEWTPVRQISNALDAAFYASLGFIEPSNSRTLLALDISMSMIAPAGGTVLSCLEAETAMAMATMAAEPRSEAVAFTGPGYASSAHFGTGASLTPLDISPRRRLDDNLQAVRSLRMGGTDCALPMTWALNRREKFDTFVVYTDNETWAGRIHPFQALREYREQTGIDAKLVVVGMTATEFSIADPNDAGMLDVAGFDSAVPSLISDFSAGRV